MGTFGFCLLLFCILAFANSSTPDCVGEQQGIPSDHAQVSGLWNLIALSLCPSAPYGFDIATYAYTNLSVTETGVNFTIFYNPMAKLDGYDYYYERIPGSTAYKYVTTDGKGVSLSEDELENFKEWSKCNGLDQVKVLKPHISYAQVCHGHFEISENLKELKDTETWGLIAKASTYPDPHYDIRLLYSAKLEISKKGNEYTVREIQTVSVMEKTLMELKYEQGVTGSKINLREFKTEENVLLLGIENETGRTLYLASKTSKAKQSLLEEFDVHAKCFQGNYTYFVPGSKKEATD